MNVADHKTLACKLGTSGFNARKGTIITAIRSIITHTHELPDGYRFVIRATDENIDQVHSFVKTERECCAFFSFQVALPSGSDELHLSITGPEGAKEFIHQEMGL